MANVIVGKDRKIIAPKVKVNGEDLTSLEINMRAGDLPTCSMSLPIEKYGRFGEFGDEVSVEMESETYSGIFFKGIMLGDSISVDASSTKYRADAVHKNAFSLDSASVFMPGAMPGSAADAGAILKLATRGFNAAGSPQNSYEIKPGDFWDQVKKALNKHMDTVGQSATRLQKPEEGGMKMVKEALGQVKSGTGNWSLGVQALSGVSADFTSQLFSGQTSSTYWNFMQRFLAQYDLVPVCYPDGKMFIVPNFAGIKSNGIEISADHLCVIAQSCKYNRTHEKVIVMVTNSPPPQMGNVKVTPTTCKVGEYKEEIPPKGACGNLCVEPPHFLRRIADRVDTEGLYKQYAKLVSCREISKMNLLTITVPFMPGAVPGLPVKINYQSLIKPYIGSMLSPASFWDGYCVEVSHVIASSSAPSTTMSFSNITKQAKYKGDKHPFWPDGKTDLKWTL